MLPALQPGLSTSCQSHVTLPTSASASDEVIQATGGEPAKALTVGLLGPLLVSMAGRPVELPAGRVRTLLAVLAMSPGLTVSADRLATALWGEDPPGDARANVRTNVRRLRRVLDAGLVETRRSGYVLGIGADQVDALRMVRLLEEAAAAPDRAAERARLVEALALWRGTPFDGVRSDWLEQTVSPWLQERYLAGLERRVDLDMALGLGRGHDLVAELDELATRFPMRESLWARLLRPWSGQAGRPRRCSGTRRFGLASPRSWVPTPAPSCNGSTPICSPAVHRPRPTGCCHASSPARSTGSPAGTRS